MNKNNNSSLIFSNRSAINMSGTSNLHHLGGFGSKLTQSNQLHAISNLSPMKQVNSDFDEHQLYVMNGGSSHQQFSALGGNPYGGEHSMNGLVQSQRGFAAAPSKSNGAMMMFSGANNLQDTAASSTATTLTIKPFQSLTQNQPSIFNIVHDIPQSSMGGRQQLHEQLMPHQNTSPAGGLL